MATLRLPRYNGRGADAVDIFVYIVETGGMERHLTLKYICISATQNRRKMSLSYTAE